MYEDIIINSEIFSKKPILVFISSVLNNVIIKTFAYFFVKRSLKLNNESVI